MLTELAAEYPIIKDTFSEASEILDKDLWKMTQADSEGLNQTENTQPIMLAAGVAVWRIWLSQGGCAPVAIAGHSLGEYSAFVASGVINYAEAVSLVAKRASLMQQAVPDGVGAMAAILGLDDEVIISTCADIASGVVEAVNFNSPGQVVIAGEVAAVDDAIEKLSEAGAKRAIKLSVSVPSHCSLMRDAAEKLSEALTSTTFSGASFPIIQNVSANSFEETTEQQAALAQQLYQPVQWVQTIHHMVERQQADSIIEFGPGKVLFGLNRRINRKLGNICINDVASLDKALNMCNV